MAMMTTTTTVAAAEATTTGTSNKNNNIRRTFEAENQSIGRDNEWMIERKKCTPFLYCE